MNAALAFGSWPRPTIFTHVWDTLGFSFVAKSVNYDIRVNTSIIGKKVLLTAQYLLSGCKNAIFLNNPEIKHFRTLSISCPQDETWIRNILHILRSCVFICLAKSIARKLIKLSRHQFLKKKKIGIKMLILFKEILCGEKGYTCFDLAELKLLRTLKSVIWSPQEEKNFCLISYPLELEEHGKKILSVDSKAIISSISSLKMNINQMKQKLRRFFKSNLNTYTTIECIHKEKTGFFFLRRFLAALKKLKKDLEEFIKFLKKNKIHKRLQQNQG